MGLFSRNKGHGLTKLEKLNTHTCGHGPLRFVEESPPVDAPLPEEWRALPALSPTERVGVMADRMDLFVGDVLPKTVDFIRWCGRDAGACQFFCVCGLEVGGDPVGVGGGELGEGLFPVGGELALDETGWGGAFAGGFALVLVAFAGAFVLDVADRQPQ